MGLLIHPDGLEVGGTELAGMEDPIGMEALAERKAITMRKKLKLYCILEIRMESIKIDYIGYVTFQK